MRVICQQVTPDRFDILDGEPGHEERKLGHITRHVDGIGEWFMASDSIVRHPRPEDAAEEVVARAAAEAGEFDRFGKLDTGDDVAAPLPRFRDECDRFNKIEVD